jgi:MoxR-like ATPase
LRSSKAYAAIKGRDFVTPEDIQMVAIPVLRHRVMLTAEKEMEGIPVDTILQQLIAQVEIPR